MGKQTLFISYNWKDGNVYADELENQLNDKFEIKRDKSQLVVNDDIYDFMAKIIDCDNVIIVLTEEYVKSLNCMLEMSYMFGQKDWKEKVTVLVIDETLYSTERKLEVINYWMLRKTRNVLSKQIFDNGNSILEEEQGYIEHICEQLEKFLRGVTRRKNPSQIAIVNEVIKKAESCKEKKEDVAKDILEKQKKVSDIIAKNSNITVQELLKKSNVSFWEAQRLTSKLAENKKIIIEGTGDQRKYRLIDAK